MWLLNLFSKESKNDYERFSNWLDSIFKQKIPNDIKAFNFNLYEWTDETYHIQLIWTNDFDEQDEDWACSDYFTTNENICRINREWRIKDWQNWLIYIKNLIEKYLDNNNLYDKFKNLEAIGVWFADWDIKIISSIEKNKLKKIIEELKDISKFKNSYLELFSEKDWSISISWNKDGLILLAKNILTLANTEENWYHFHLDKHSIFDETNSELIISYKTPKNEGS